MNSLPIINMSYDLYKDITTLSEQQLNKRWRYSLGVSIEQTLLDCLELLIMAKNAPKSLKSGYLIKASAKHETLMLKVRLLLELHLANETTVFQLQAKLQEIGRMLGGWLKSTYST